MSHNMYAKGTLAQRQAEMWAKNRKGLRRGRKRDPLQKIDVERFRRRLAGRILITKHHWTATQLAKHFGVNLASVERWVAIGMPLY